MKIEYIPDGSADCPLIRLFGHDPEAAARLRDACHALASGGADAVAIHGMEGFMPIDHATLTAVASSRNQGVMQVDTPNAFRWELTPAWWSNVEGLLGPFCPPDPTPSAYQWLDETSGISVLISPTGKW